MSCSDLRCKASLPSAGLDALTLLGVKDICQLPWSGTQDLQRSESKVDTELRKDPRSPLKASHLSSLCEPTCPLVIPVLLGLNRTDLWMLPLFWILGPVSKACLYSGVLPSDAGHYAIWVFRPVYGNKTRGSCLRSKRWSPSVIEPTMSCAGATSSNDL